jgi:hypothetical protein
MSEGSQKGTKLQITFTIGLFSEVGESRTAIINALTCHATMEKLLISKVSELIPRTAVPEGGFE